MSFMRKLVWLWITLSLSLCVCVCVCMCVYVFIRAQSKERDVLYFSYFRFETVPSRHQCIVSTAAPSSIPPPPPIGICLSKEITLHSFVLWHTNAKTKQKKKKLAFASLIPYSFQGPALTAPPPPPG